MRRHDAPLRASRHPSRHNRPVSTRPDERRRRHETREIERAVRDSLASLRALRRRAARLGDHGA